MAAGLPPHGMRISCASGGERLRILSSREIGLEPFTRGGPDGEHTHTHTHTHTRVQMEMGIQINHDLGR